MVEAAAAAFPADPFGSQHGHEAWVRLQVEQMLQDAARVVEEADDPAVPQLSEAARQDLQQAFTAKFSTMLQQEQCPSQGQVLCWLKEHLHVQEGSYGACSDGDDQEEATRQQGQQQVAAAADSTAYDTQHQQQAAAGRRRGKHPKLQQAPSRRSSRSNLGQMSPGYAAVFGHQQGSSAGRSVSRDRGGGKGGSSELQQDGTTTQLLTPAITAAPPSRARRRGGGPTA